MYFDRLFHRFLGSLIVIYHYLIEMLLNISNILVVLLLLDELWKEIIYYRIGGYMAVVQLDLFLNAVGQVHTNCLLPFSLLTTAVR